MGNKMKCPNTYCGDSAAETVKTDGSGSRYCTSCGFYEEFKVDPKTVTVPKTVHPPVPPRKKAKKTRDK